MALLLLAFGPIFAENLGREVLALELPSHEVHLARRPAKSTYGCVDDVWLPMVEAITLPIVVKIDSISPVIGLIGDIPSRAPFMASSSLVCGVEVAVEELKLPRVLLPALIALTTPSRTRCVTDVVVVLLWVVVVVRLESCPACVVVVALLGVAVFVRLESYSVCVVELVL